MSNRLDALAMRKYKTQQGEEKTAYTKVGVAFANRGGGYTLTLESVPVAQPDRDGVMSVRILLAEPRDSGGQRAQGGGQQNRAADHLPGPGYEDRGGPGAAYSDDIPFAPVDTRGEV